MLKQTVGLQKSFSYHHRAVNADFKHSSLIVRKTLKPGTPCFRPESLAFGKTHTDHMLKIESDGKKWNKPEIFPFAPFELDPFNSTLHYSIACFEGMKAYWGVDGEIRMFRPWDNIGRLSTSMERLGMDAPFDHEELLKCMSELILLDKKWMPKQFGQSMYIRP